MQGVGVMVGVSVQNTNTCTHHMHTHHTLPLPRLHTTHHMHTHHTLPLPRLHCRHGHDGHAAPRQLHRGCAGTSGGSGSRHHGTATLWARGIQLQPIVHTACRQQGEQGGKEELRPHTPGVGGGG
jgi:hypothetical protein